MEGRFVGREIIDKPSCPFCGRMVEKPKELPTRMPQEMPVGACDCGAVFACDITGHNLGTAMIEALVFACDGDWDLAWDLLPEEDYLEKQVKHYDLETHLIIHGGVYQGRRIGGTLFFIRLYKDIREVTEAGVQERWQKATPLSDASSAEESGEKAFTKRQVEALVKAYDVQPLLDAAEGDKRIIRDLKRLLYSVDDLTRWKAADILGRVCAVIAERDPGTVSRLLQGFFTSLTDSAASSWGALDAIGEVIGNRPEQFSGYIPQLLQLTRDRALLPDVLRALGRIARSRPELARKGAFRFIPLLQDPDPRVRTQATLLLAALKARESKDDLLRLKEDATPVTLYRKGALVETSISELAFEALNQI